MEIPKFYEIHVCNKQGTYIHKMYTEKPADKKKKHFIFLAEKIIFVWLLFWLIYQCVQKSVFPTFQDMSY